MLILQDLVNSSMHAVHAHVYVQVLVCRGGCAHLNALHGTFRDAGEELEHLELLLPVCATLAARLCDVAGLVTHHLVRNLLWVHRQQLVL